MAKFINRQNEDVGKQVILRFPKGVDQVSQETALLPGAARRIVNFDVHQGAVIEGTTFGGRLSRRSSVKKLISGNNVHSLWASGKDAYFIDSGTLYKLDINLEQYVVRTGLNDSKMYYTELAGVVYYSNEHYSGKIVAGKNRAWGMSIPPAPNAVSIPYGGLTEGVYQIAYTRLSSDGEESGASPTTLVRVPDGGGISLNNVPGILDHVTRVYVSKPNGDILYWVQDIAFLQATSYVGVHVSGKQLMTQFTVPPTGWTHLEQYNGRIYGAKNNTLVATQALNYNLTRLTTDFLLFPEKIIFIKSVVDGIYVGTSDGVVFLQGNEFGQFVQRPMDSLPPIEGSDLAISGQLFGASGKGVIWLTRRGWVFGANGGQTKRLTESQMALPQYDYAATLYREYDGMRQVMTFVKGGTEGAGISDSYETEIIRNGRII